SLVIPIALGVQVDHLYWGMNIALGALLVSPCNVSGSPRLKITGMFLACILITSVSLLVGFFQGQRAILLVLIGMMMFGISYISIYGFRASLISFSGLFALVLSISPISSPDLAPYQSALLVGSGGLWYIGLTRLQQWVFPKAEIEFHLAETIKLTANYIRIRGQLIDAGNDRPKL